MVGTHVVHEALAAGDLREEAGGSFHVHPALLVRLCAGRGWGTGAAVALGFDLEGKAEHGRSGALDGVNLTVDIVAQDKTEF